MKKMTCIMCPMGCELTITKEGETYHVSGNTCIRGERYGISEMQNPTRMITALVKTSNGIVSVKTTNLVPKDKMFDVLNEISKLKVKTANYGDVLIKNVLNLDGVDVVVTREAK